MEPVPVFNPLDPESTDTKAFDSIRKALESIPDGHSNAIVLDGGWTANTGASAWVSVMHKAPDGWNVVTQFSYDQPHGAGAGVMLAKSW